MLFRRSPCHLRIPFRQVLLSTRHLISAQGTLPKITTANSRFTRFNRSAKGPKAKLVAPPQPDVWLKSASNNGKHMGKTFNHPFCEKHSIFGGRICWLATPVAESQLDSSTSQLNTRKWTRPPSVHLFLDTVPPCGQCISSTRSGLKET